MDVTKVHDSTAVTPFKFPIPQCIPTCKSLEDFCGVHTQTSDQHCDLRARTTVRDGKDFDKYQNWLKSHFRLTD